MEEPIQSGNVTFSFKKKYLVIIALAIIALLAFFLLPGSIPSEQTGGVPQSQVPANYQAPELPPTGTAPHIPTPNLIVGEEAVQGKIYFYWEGKQIAANGTLKVQIIAGQDELYSKQFSLSEHDFNFNETTFTRASTEKGYQEIIEETVTDIFYDLSIPLTEIKKGTSSSANITIEIVSQSGGTRSETGSLKDLPKDPTKFTGNPELISGPFVVVERLSEINNYKGFFSLTEKGIPVSSSGTLVISAENKEGTQILSKTVQIQPADFSFETIKYNIMSPSGHKKLKYVFEFSSTDTQEGECPHKILVSFTPSNGQALEKSTSSKGNCLFNCSLSTSCPK